MPLRAAVVSDEDLVYSIAEGCVTTHDVCRCVERCLASPAFHCGMNVCFVIDTDVQPALAADRLRRKTSPLIQQYRESFVGYKVAFVFLEEQHAAPFQGVVDMVPAMAACQSFGSLRAAFAWLGYAHPARLHSQLLGQAETVGVLRESEPSAEHRTAA